VSVPSAADPQSTYCATLVDEWIACGVTDAVLSPGSRSTPFVLALAERPEISLHVRIDERSAAYFAIGRTLVTDRATLMIVTSGTAAAELHAAICEADLARVALIVVTADRPPDQHGVGAPQTIDQRHLYGDKVRLFEDPGVPTFDGAGAWRAIARRLHGAASQRPSGPVHLNAPFAEPLLGVVGALPPASVAVRPPSTVEAGTLEVDAERVLVVAGPGVSSSTLSTCRDRRWPVVGDATCLNAVPYADAILRDDATARALAPDLVVRVGGLPASKALGERLRNWSAPVLAWTCDGPVADPDRVVTDLAQHLVVRAGAVGSYARLWAAASEIAGSVATRLDDLDGALCEPAVARAVVTASSRHGVPLVVGSSMPIRDVEWWSPARQAATFANRGVNGIDGVSSTAFGVAAGRRAIGFVGDLTFLHDVGSLVDGLGEAGGCCVLVVADNGGGGIFSFLPQAAALDAERFERLFTTPRAHDLVAIGSGFGHRARRVKTLGELASAIDEAVERRGIEVIVAAVPSVTDNVEIHDELVRDVARALRSFVP
jgi:2-succinyl-5-enolpyruvyl-6-hydroxy-3-cyclohexene-1-carboxylate synthase